LVDVDGFGLVHGHFFRAAGNEDARRDHALGADRELRDPADEPSMAATNDAPNTTVLMAMSLS
jgi:hypothetical protein